jgi:hypothetical protein
MISPFRYDGHICRIVETEHTGFVMYDGFVDDQQVCWDRPTEAGLRCDLLCSQKITE